MCCTMLRMRIGFTIFALLGLLVGASLAGKGGGGKKPPPDEPPADPAIAFHRINMQHGQMDLMVMNADGTNVTLVLAGVRGKPGVRPVQHRSPSWSPGADRFAFVSNVSGDGIYVVGIDGGNLQQLVVNGGRQPSWSPVSKCGWVTK